MSKVLCFVILGLAIASHGCIAQGEPVIDQEQLTISSACGAQASCLAGENTNTGEPSPVQLEVLSPVAPEQCGTTTCTGGTWCCNSSCSACVAKGNWCDTRICTPDD